jgi:transposase-like protein
MVRNYVRKTNWQAWSAQSMEEAVASVLRGDMGLKKASHQFNVPKTILQRAVKKQQDETFTIDKSRGKIQNVFSREQELELVQYFQHMDVNV